jgi:3-mercaptopyruvate sulfurtransferase SseA
MRFILTIAAAVIFAAAGITACQQNAAPPVANSTAAQNGNSSSSNSGSNTVAEQPKNAAPKVDEHGHADDAPRISLADAKKEFDAGSAVFVDTRAAATYKSEHIKGAINVPMEAVETKYKEIPKGKKIIAYCS